MSAVVFDCDGLLLDTEACWSRAEAALFSKFGHDFGPEEKDLLIGRALDDACENAAKYFYLADLYQLPLLKSKAMEFITRNQKQVRQSDGWKEFIQPKSELLEMLFEYAAENPLN